MIDAGYTADDHAFREDDAYANGKYELTLRWLGTPRDGNRRLFNIGCGTGLFNRLAHDAGFEVEACEPDLDAHAIAEQDAPAGVRVHFGGLFDTAFSTQADIVVMHDVLEHIEDEAAAVARLHQVIAPNGRVILSVPAMPSLFGLHDKLLGHHRRYTRRSLRRAIDGSFRVKQMRSYGLSMIPVTLVLSRLLRKPYPAPAAANSSLVGRAFDVVCRIESRIATPIGTSLVCELTPERTITSALQEPK